MKKQLLSMAALLVASSAYGAGSCVICPYGYTCEGGTEQPTYTGVGAPFPGVQAPTGWYLFSKGSNSSTAIERRQLWIKAGTIVTTDTGSHTFASDTAILSDIESLNLSNGKDYDVCIGNSGAATTVLHNAACPSETLKVGGFHTMPCAISIADDAQHPENTNHPYKNYPAGTIVNGSIWTLKHHPMSSDGGYAYDYDMGKWVMMYPASLTDSPYGVYPGEPVQTAGTADTTTANINAATRLVSRFEWQMANSMTMFEQEDLLVAGKSKALTGTEFASASKGSNQGTSRAANAKPSPFTASCGAMVDSKARSMISDKALWGATGLIHADLDYMAGHGAYVYQTGTATGSTPHRTYAGGAWADANTQSGSHYRTTYESVISRIVYIGARGASLDIGE